MSRKNIHFSSSHEPGSNPTRVQLNMLLTIPPTQQHNTQHLEHLINQDKEKGPILLKQLKNRRNKNNPNRKPNTTYHDTLNLDHNPITEAIINALHTLNGPLNPDKTETANNIHAIINAAREHAWLERNNL